MNPAGQDLSTDPLLGQCVDGRYRVLRAIGEGGMGKVYLVEHVDLGKRSALKVLHATFGQTPDMVERFRREARAASRIGDPHIVDVTDSGTTAGGAAYFVMELLDGDELSRVIDRDGKIELERALRIAGQLAAALAAAHAAGIIHRDLKPENIFLTTRDGVRDFVKILDFGVAKTSEAMEPRKLTSPGIAMGTPRYMAPEQAAGRPADARADIYSLGAVLHEMLTGHAPYEGDNFLEILTKKATVDPVAVAVLNPEIPGAVSALVSRAMARYPDQRPPTMTALGAALARCLEPRRASSGTPAGGLPIVAATTPMPTMIAPATAPPPMALARPASRRAQTLAALAITAALVGVALVAVRATAASTPPAAAPLAQRAIDASPAVASPPPRLEVATPGPPSPIAPAPPAPPPTEPAAAPRPSRRDHERRARARDKDRAARAAALLATADQRYRALDWPGAIAGYREVIATRRSLPAAYLGLARATWQNKDLDGAIAAAEHALDAGAGDAARVFLGHLHRRAGSFARARIYYDEVLAHDPQHREARTALDAMQRARRQAN